MGGNALQWWSAMLLILLDQLTKHWAAGLSAPIAIGSFFAFRFSLNTGAAFSSFTAYPKILTVITLVAVVVIPTLFKKVEKKMHLPLLLIWAGAIGNVIDRLTIGAVRDFIAFSFWPSFNVADAAITIGALWILGMELKKNFKAPAPKEIHKEC